MSWREVPWSARIVWSALAAIALATVGWLWRVQAELARTTSTLNARERTWAKMQQTQASATAAARAAAARQAAEDRGKRLRATLWPANPSEQASRPPPDDRSSAFIELLRYQEEMRALAAQAAVTVIGPTTFGFDAYAQMGPEAEVRSHVHRQRILAERLIRPLLAARPERWLGLRREAAPREQRQDSGGMPSEAFLTSEPARPGLELNGVTRLTFELRFIAETETLRRYLNHLAGTDAGWVVRSVHVQPAEAPAATAGATASSATSVIVATTRSEFTIIVDCYDATDV